MPPGSRRVLAGSWILVPTAGLASGSAGRGGATCCARGVGFPAGRPCCGGCIGRCCCGGCCGCGGAGRTCTGGAVGETGVGGTGRAATGGSRGGSGLDAGATTGAWVAVECSTAVSGLRGGSCSRGSLARNTGETWGAFAGVGATVGVAAGCTGAGCGGAGCAGAAVTTVALGRAGATGLTNGVCPGKLAPGALATGRRMAGFGVLLLKAGRGASTRGGAGGGVGTSSSSPGRGPTLRRRMTGAGFVPALFPGVYPELLPMEPPELPDDCPVGRRSGSRWLPWRDLRTASA